MTLEEKLKILKKPTLFIQKNHPELVQELKDFCLKYNILHSPKTFKQVVYHFVNNLTEMPRCENCGGSNVTFDTPSVGYKRFCSKKCSATSSTTRQTCINTIEKRYGKGLVNVSQISEVREKVENTNLDRIGVRRPAQSKEVQQKMGSTNLIRFGTANASQSEQIKKKISINIRRTLEIDGENIRRKKDDTMIKRYGIINSVHMRKNNRESKYEVLLCEKLEGKKEKIKFKEFDIVLEEEKIVIEVDGSRYHVSNLVDIDFSQLNHVINDIQKDHICELKGYKLYRIDYKVAEKLVKNNIATLENVINNSYIPNRNFTEIKDVVTSERITRFYQYSYKKDFIKGIVNLRRLYKHKFGIWYDNNDLFLKEIYNLDFKEKTVKSYLEKINLKEVKSYSVLIPKDFFIKFVQEFGRDRLEKEIDFILMFLYTNFPELKTSDTLENLDKIDKAVKRNKVEDILQGKEFSNHCSVVGISFLKSIFRSYFNSSFKNEKTPIELYKNYDFIYKIIKYRIGCNDTGEFYDLSFKNIVRGLSAVRKTISFFKPVLAAKIYKHFLQDKESPIVLDPCCGFGGRMLGFFSEYPQGTYIGCEPNSQTFSELLILRNHLEDHYGFQINCEIYNLTIEEFIERKVLKDRQIDLTFTSIPYYDLEIYSHNVVGLNYKDFNDWKKKFINCIFDLPSSLINLPIDLYDKCSEIHDKVKDTFYLVNYSSNHMQKVKLNKKKLELIIKCF